MGLAIHQLAAIRKSGDKNVYEVFQQLVNKLQNLELQLGIPLGSSGSSSVPSDPGEPGVPAGPEAPFVFVDSVGLGITFNIVPPDGAVKYGNFKFYTVQIYSDANRNTLVVEQDTNKDWKGVVPNTVQGITLQMQTPGRYYWNVYGVNASGAGESTKGDILVDGLAAAPQDGVPGAPTVALRGTTLGGDVAVFSLTRPTTGFNQIGLYTLVARTESTFAFTYTSTAFTAKITPGTGIIESGTAIFSAGDVGKLIEVNGITQNGVDGITHLFIVTAFIDTTHVQTHFNINIDLSGLSAKIGTAWWNDSNFLWTQDFFVQGPNALESPDKDKFEFTVPYDGTTMHVSAFAVSVYGLSTWAGSASTTTTALLVSAGRGLGVPVMTGSFTSTNDRRVDWSSGTIKYGDGTTETYLAGNTGTLPSDVTRWIYKIFGNTTLQIASDVLLATGPDRIPVGIIRTKANAGELAEFSTLIASDHAIFTKLSSLFLDVGSVTAGTMTGVLIRTSASGRRVELSSSDIIDFYNASGVKVGDIDVDGAGNLEIKTILTNTKIVLNGKGGVNFELDNILVAGLDDGTPRHLSPSTDGGVDLGTSASGRWGDCFFQKLNLSEELDLDTNNATFLPRWFVQSTAPTVATGEFLVWSLSVSPFTISLLFNDGTNTVAWDHDRVNP